MERFNRYRRISSLRGIKSFIEKLRKNEKVKNATIIKIAKKMDLISLAKTSTVEFAFGGLGLNKS